MHPSKRIEFGSRFFSFVYDFLKLERLISVKTGLFSGQARILTVLKNYGDNRSLSELSELCDIGISSLSVSIQNMEKKGFVKKVNGEKDNRLQLVSLTDSGREKAQVFHTLIDDFFKGLIRELGNGDAEEASALFTKLTEYTKNTIQKY
jgi:DNA-binding MarR family transcriptional regulator